MPVPKRKTSPSKRGMRRSANSKLNPINIVINKTTGSYQLQHHVSEDGYYNGKKVIKEKQSAPSKTE